MLLVAGSAASPDTVTAAIGSTVTVTDRVSPADVTITAGTSVLFVNDDNDRHRMRTTSGPEEFDTGDIEAGAQFEVVLTVIGTYQYEDRRQSGNSAYAGTIIVTAEPAPPPTTDPGSPPPTSPAPTTSSVSILDRSFSPASLSISAGSTVVWTNVSGRDHNVVADDGSFASADLAGGATYTGTFTTPGTFRYFCSIHPDMTGVVAVGAAGAPPPPAPPPPSPTATPPPPPSGTTGPDQSPSGPSTGAVRIVDYAYEPATISVRAGDTLVWTNLGRAPHTVTADDRSFDSGRLASGGTYSRTFTSPGTFAYFCTLHPEMRAVVAVGAADEPPPAPPPPPGPSPTSSSTTRAGAGGSIQMFDYGYRPSTYSARVGDRVVWNNDGLAPHTATARDGSFDTGLVAAGARGSVTLRQAGTFTYFCTIHPQMTATIKVAEALPGTVLPDAEELADPEPNRDTTESEPGRLTTSVGVVDFGYDPDPVVVQVGTTVTWEWLGLSPHTVTDEAGSFDSGILVRGDSWSRTFDQVGTIRYVCTLHPDMKGSIEIVETPVPATATERDPTSPPLRSGSADVQPEMPQPLPLSESAGTANNWVGVLVVGLLIIGMLLLGARRFFKYAAAEQARTSRRTPANAATRAAATRSADTEPNDERFAKWILGGMVGVLALITLPLTALGVLAVATADDPEELQVQTANTTEISLNEFTISGGLDVPAGPVNVNVTNEGAIEHNLAVRELTVSTRDLEPGSSSELDLGELTAGAYEIYCTLAGHADAGMRNTLMVSA
jgi:plastocyanin